MNQDNKDIVNILDNFLLCKNEFVLRLIEYFFYQGKLICIYEYYQCGLEEAL